MPKLEKSISLSYGGPSDNVASSEPGIRVTLPDVSELTKLPSSGTITFRYDRDTLRLQKDDTLSADIRLCEITEIEGDEASEEKKDDVVDKLFAEAKDEPEGEESE